jgi:AcrR family transcriptional regulator
MRLDRATRERQVLDTAARLFYARGVHEVGMDELVAESGLGKATVYRLYPTKDLLIGAYLERLSGEILALIDADAARGPRETLHAALDAIRADLGRPDFRGCAFHNASTEFDDPAHPARAMAREHRAALHRRFVGLAERILPPERARTLGARLAVLVDGAYTSAAHLGPDGPAAAGMALAHELVDADA